MSGRFLSKLSGVESENDRTFTLDQAFLYYSDVTGRVIKVPAGFVTDFASVPRVPLAYLLAGDTAKWAAVIHDYLYQAKPGNPDHVAKDVADSVFLEAMEASGQPKWRRTAMYWAVRLFGGEPYLHDQQEGTQP